MIRFEHPLSERVRSFLRIEHLFRRFHTESLRQENSPWPHHLALFTLFEIMECAGRAELKLDILQELERQKQFAAVGRIGGGQTALSAQLHAVAENLQGIKQKFGQHLRENDWLMAIKQRMSVAGGTSPFDLPAYYFWQQQPYAHRLADLQKWAATLLPTQEAVGMLLSILRGNAVTVDCVAQKGSYQSSSLTQSIHMLIIEVGMQHQVLPEISANKYVTHIRFLEASQEYARGRPAAEDVPFKLMMCSFDPT
ncbi:MULTISPECIES: cell division protein ZapD [Neisseria]|uniref:Cell division protein ZapD n=1 Tax=Neisseria musculi TaxID=1815583 RepID=A0A7H1MA28_9NEIS|nr:MULTISPECIES: cell division protein ZapD [Neisseria]MBF0803558.1 cell division protein ZapD [Neisseria sp. 19428wB4_WF04]QNT58493.1 hypothetical protein H7A79_1818 [Neisseria musculi]TFU43737.1 cell division protein ZapD [Neisseria sp. WF04]